VPLERELCRSRPSIYVEASFLFGPDVVEHLKTMNRKTKFDIDWFAEPFRRVYATEVTTLTAWRALTETA
jgi:hypothetical protein